MRNDECWLIITSVLYYRLLVSYVKENQQVLQNFYNSLSYSDSLFPNFLCVFLIKKLLSIVSTPPYPTNRCLHAEVLSCGVWHQKCVCSWFVWLTGFSF